MIQTFSEVIRLKSDLAKSSHQRLSYLLFLNNLEDYFFLNLEMKEVELKSLYLVGK